MLIDSTHRKWLVATAGALAASIAVYVPYARNEPHGPTGGSPIGLAFGIAGFALMLFAGLLGARKKVPVWRLGRAQTWMRGHLWLGLLSYPLILFHAGFAMRGTVTMVLMVLFTIVIVSGIVGAVFQHYIPRIMTIQLPMETIYEQIPSVRAQLLGEADKLVSTVAGAIGKEAPVQSVSQAASETSAAAVSVAVDVEEAEMSPLKEFYLKEMRPYLQAPAHRRNDPLSLPKTAEAVFKHLRTLLPPAFHDTVDDLENICEEERQLTRQAGLYRWLHAWLVLHIPLSLALLILGAIHAVMALKY